MTPPPAEPLDPVAFSAWWVIGAVALVVLAATVAASPWWLAWLRRRHPAQDQPAPPAGPVSLAGRQGAALAQIDRIESAWQAGETTDRAAAQAIAAAVKAFAGSEVETLTLLELKIKGAQPTLVEAIEAAYPVEFGVTGQGDVAALAARARTAVRL